MFLQRYYLCTALIRNTSSCVSERQCKGSGEMAEWLIAAVLKTAVPERVPGVRIPVSPQEKADLVRQVGFFIRIFYSINIKKWQVIEPSQ